MNKKEKFALFLGMLSGDGCLPIKHSGEGYRDYAIQFYNTDKNIVILFKRLFYELWGIKGKLYYADRKNRKRLWNFCKYSRKIVEELKEKEFPEGVKRDILRIPKLIKQGIKKEKLAFILGFLITDGCIRKKGGIMFHSGSKLFLKDLSWLISEFTDNKKEIKEFIQKEKFKSYQLTLNSKETKFLLTKMKMPTWDNGTPTALRFLNK